MRSVLLLLLSFFTPVIWAQNVEQSKLWPDKQNANEAEIYIYHPKESDKVAPSVLEVVIQDWQWIVKGMIWLNGMLPMDLLLLF